MKLFSSSTSPYVRKIRILIDELDLSSSIEVVASSSMDNPPDLHAANPLGKVPALILDDGSALYDSVVIFEYIDAQHGNKFLATSGNERWDCLRRHALADGIIDASYLRTVARVRPDAEQSALWHERWSNAILRGIDVMAQDLKTAGDRFDMGDVAAACALGYLDLRHSDLEWRKGRDELADWFSTVSERNSVQTTIPG